MSKGEDKGEGTGESSVVTVRKGEISESDGRAEASADASSRVCDRVISLIEGTRKRKPPRGGLQNDVLSSG
jgi:hypothetical protein